MGTFKRYEIKYILTKYECNLFKLLLNDYMLLDEYKEHKINNIYFDSISNKLINTSILKPYYKEKVRLRFYNELNINTTGFIELKKKYEGIVYKRRFSCNYFELIKMIDSSKLLGNQITREIDYAIKFYNIKPKIQLTYLREAYYNNSNLRITIDKNIKYKYNDIYNFKTQGISLNDDIYLIEVKTQNGLPRWLLDFFNKNKIYKQSFSKYGEVYKKIKGEFDVYV